MNKKWNAYLSSVLGYFWDRVFSGYEFLGGIKQALSECGSSIHDTADILSQNTTIMQHKDYIPTQAERVIIPKDKCFENIRPIQEFVLNSGLDIKQGTMGMTLSVPIAYLGKDVAVQDAITHPDNVWLDGINMSIDDKYATLHLPVGCTITEDIEYCNDGTIIPCYVLYVTHKSYDIDRNSNYGSLMGIDVSTIDVPGIRILWDLYHRGPKLSTLNKVVSYIVDSDTCESSGTVLNIWTEGDWCCISTTGNKIYTGKGAATVTRGDYVQKGQLLFDCTHRYDADNLPTVDELPVLVVNNEGSALTAVNMDIPVITSVTGETIPDYASDDWAALEFPTNMLHEGVSSQNPLHYLFTSMYPGTLVQYTLDADKCRKDLDILSRANDIVCGGDALGGLTTVILSVRLPDVDCTGTVDTITAGYTTGSTASILKPSVDSAKCIRF